MNYRNYCKIIKYERIFFLFANWSHNFQGAFFAGIKIWSAFSELHRGLITIDDSKQFSDCRGRILQAHLVTISFQKIVRMILIAILHSNNSYMITIWKDISEKPNPKNYLSIRIMNKWLYSQSDPCKHTILPLSLLYCWVGICFRL